MNQVTVFAAESTALTFTDKKGNLHGITAEGALFKGGAALAALKEAGLESAVAKAVGGRYRAASDILVAAFPKAGKAFHGVWGAATAPHANKTTMQGLLAAVETAIWETAAADKKLTKRQDAAAAVAEVLRKIPALATETAPVVVVENATEGTPQA